MNRVLFFAHLRDAVGGAEFLTVDAGGKTVAELKAELAAKYDLPKMDTVMTAVNEEFASNDEVIQDGDEIAFIPPVSGG
ncbi:molybdopterin converting factor subunit 1 [Bacillus sp. X1(2014)]|uniref:molybdopterin converting factor subunit 1 n=1 Tax=Bacillus sp. X1(2014) TaxID=1565991 RepID=UPI0011AAA577|nr:molybdopterin converting factor subunit 1 [Bacillus sp. X1(2014)]